MLNLLSKIKIIDNTGGKLGIIIKRLKPKTIKAYASIGHIVSISMRKSEGKIKRKKVYEGMIVRTKKKGNMINKQKIGGHSIIWDDNGAILVKKDSTPIGTRIKGPICKSLKYKNMKIGALKI